MNKDNTNHSISGISFCEAFKELTCCLIPHDIVYRLEVPDLKHYESVMGTKPMSLQCTFTIQEHHYKVRLGQRFILLTN